MDAGADQRQLDPCPLSEGEGMIFAIRGVVEGAPGVSLRRVASLRPGNKMGGKGGVIPSGSLSWKRAWPAATIWPATTCSRTSKESCGALMYLTGISPLTATSARH